MKKTILVIWIIYGFLVPQRMMAVDVAYVADGVIVAVPVTLPVVGVRIDTQQAVLNLYGVDTATLNACGYYPVVRSEVVAQTNQYVSARSWMIEDGNCVEQLTFSNRAKKVTLDRVKLAGLVKAQGWTEAFQGFVNSDPEISVRWYSSEKLVAGSDEMKPFIEGFALMIGIPYTNAVTLLDQCKEDRR